MRLTAPKPPDNLDSEAKAEWVRIEKELKKSGQLDQTDRAIITLHCRSWAAWCKAMTTVEAEGFSIVYSNGVEAFSPEFKASQMLSKVLLSTTSELGLTPAQRLKRKPTDSKIVPPLRY